MRQAVGLGIAALLMALPGQAQEAPEQSPRTGAIEFKLGGFKPRIDDEPGLSGRPFEDTFGSDSMLLFEAELERFFYQGIGTAGIGFSAGYAEKYGNTINRDTGAVAAEKTALKIIPLRLSLLYKFDYAAFQWGIPLVPYAQAGLVYTPWWVNKGDETEVVNGNKASGGKWGYGFTAGVAFMLDVLEPRFARDFDSGLGVNHSYLFAEYSHSEVNNFGGGGLNLGSGHWMFGLALDY